MIVIRHFSEVLLSLIWPFVAFVSSIFHPKDRFSNFVIPIFFALIGFSRKLVISDDAAFWTEKMISYQFYTLSDFFNEVFDVSRAEYLNVGYYFYLYLFAKVFDHTAPFWAMNFFLYALILLFLYRLLNHNCCARSIHFFDIIFCYLFFFFFPFSSFGVRFWIAAILFIYGFYLLNISSSKSGYLLMCSSILFHFSFVFLLFVYLFSVLVNQSNIKKTLLYSVIFFLLFNVVYNFVFSGSLSAFDAKMEYYSNISDRGNYFSEKSFYVLLDRFLSPIFSFIILLYLYRIIPKEFARLFKILKFLLLFSFSLLMLLNFYDALDRFSRVFSFMVLSFFIYVKSIGIKCDNRIVATVTSIYFYHTLVNLLLTRSWLDFGVVNSSLFSILSGNLDTIYIN